MKKITQFLVLLFVVTLNAQTPIYQFNFNGNLNNSGTGTVTTGFVPSGAVFYGAGRNGVANNAFNSSTELTGAILPNLPTGNSARTLNVWVKFGSTNNTHYLMGWGSGTTANGGFTMYQSTATQSFFGTGGAGNWAAVNNTINTTSWYMYTYVYDGTTLKHYINGVQQSAITRNINTVAGNNGLRLSLCRFLDDTSARLGDYLIDDASIYDVALTSAQITSLYTSTSAPAITSVAASNVTFNAATINFNLNAFGSATTYVVEYTTDVLGTWQTQSGGTTSVNAATPFQVQLSNLTPNKTYFVRLKATNATGQITTSPEIQFNIPTPIVLTNVNDSNVTATTTQINYTLNTNGYNAVVEIRYQAGTFFDTDNPFTTRVITTGVNNTTATNYNYTLTGLAPNTTYSYQFGAVTQNAGGVETGENAAFTTTVPLGLNDNKQRLNFSMYPNPASSSLNIDMAAELKSLEIYSLLGQKMLSSTQKQINISNLASGIYMVRVVDQNGAIATQKLVKE
ncbi:T9SS type A sorting domain-containing protein [Flavobacterium eburneipallidum]|uniref:T9SS type A sorting domain-containing protein n=1 Tax=Flavobacterium eburneipallidum TaxID=3003263 RepID=UPI0024831898|nr:T9SS type A sorting domain-containing protein [Flavobacterium eburneipallidum]